MRQGSRPKDGMKRTTVSSGNCTRILLLDDSSQEINSWSDYVAILMDRNSDSMNSMAATHLNLPSTSSHQLIDSLTDDPRWRNTLNMTSVMPIVSVRDICHKPMRSNVSVIVLSANLLLRALCIRIVFR